MILSTFLFKKPGRNGLEYMKEIASYFIDEDDSARKAISGGNAYLGTWDSFIPIARKLGYSDAELCASITSVAVEKPSATYSGFYLGKGSRWREPLNYGLGYISLNIRPQTPPNCPLSHLGTAHNPETPCN